MRRTALIKSNNPHLAGGDKKRKGFQKKFLLTISKVNFEGTGGKIAKMKRKKREKGLRKSSF